MEEIKDDKIDKVDKIEEIEEKNELFTENKKEDKMRFVLYYANWCGHCKEMEPEWKKLEERYKNNDIIKIERYESEKDETKRERINAFPMMILYKMNGKKERYTSSRKYENMSQFVDHYISKNER